MRVLLATSDPNTRAELREILTTSRHDVTTAAHVDDAIAMVSRDMPPLVVIDDAWLDVCRHVRRHAGGDTFVLVLTSDDDAGRLEAVLAAGADDFVLSAPTLASRRARFNARIQIAERRIAQNVARRSAEAALAKSQRLAGIGDAAAALQHEINNPLAALLAHASLIEHGLHDPGEEHALLAVIVEQAHRIADVVKRIGALRYPSDAESFVPDDPA